MYEFIDLDDTQLEDIEERLATYDTNYIKYKLEGTISIGVNLDGKLVAGANGCMTAFKIFYVSTVYVDENYRNQGIGKLLMNEIEVRAKQLGTNMIRLDTFDWQGREFYKAMNYEEVGFYKNEEDNFSESFFVKRI